MKQLSIKQKAKAYDEALKEAIVAHKDEDRHLKATLERIFPELKESEDEKTKRVLHSITNKMSQHLRDIFSEEEFQCYDAWSNAWLEKQGEQKLQGKSALEAAKEEKVDNQNCVKPADKVEPKFKVGDWIVHNASRCVNQVTEIRDNEYCLYPLYAKVMGYLRIIDVDNDYHLWTIQDAKDGDVLAGHESIVIFKKIDGLNIKCYCTYHFMNFTSFYLDTLQSKDSYTPATKEQRDQLEKAMADAGYTFDFEKKELKKIEQKSANWIQKLEDKLTNSTPKQLAEWKEKYFKEEPAEWSEEDKLIISAINDIINIVERKTGDWYYTGSEKVFYSDIRNWLKSLRPQNTWKPSDEQMETLKFACGGNYVDLGVLESLYQDLKKLKEE
jgi:hypothetical protein